MKPRRLGPSEQQHLTLTITALGAQGEGLATHDGKRIYVPAALPGDIVQATLREQVDRDVYRATLDSVTMPGAERSEPPCGFYTRCGGCALQHMQENSYQAWKMAQIEARLRAAGLVADVFDTPVFIAHATRRRATFALLKRGRALSVGFNSRRSHEIVDIDACLLLDPLLLRAVDILRPYLARLLRDGKPADLFLQDVDGQLDAILTGQLAAGLTMLTRELFAEMATAANLSVLSWRASERDEAETMLRRGALLARFGRLAVDLPAGAFLQPSREGENALSTAVTDMLAEVGGKLRMADLFAGCGTFAGRMLEFGPVHAIELDAPAVAALNAARGAQKLTVEKRNLFTAPVNRKELKAYDAVLLDPPRAGAIEQCRELASSDVNGIVYVSCNPSSFARDASALIGGGYRLKRLRVVDQFIWSTHTELVGLFTR